MRLHFKTAINLEKLYNDVKTAKVGAVHVPERPNTIVLIDVYDDTTEPQIQNILTKAKNHGLTFIQRETGTFVVE
ncbi:MAG: hypothetical protein MN733_05530 [Nitrososphaera sp.]|nr:hypothetical protein [Nitrososphaera sp.]